jgi:hypothetical protein
LNDRVKQPFGPTRFREGLLLAKGLRSPVLDRRNHWASVTVGVVDQFDHCYEQRVYVSVMDCGSDARVDRDLVARAGLCEPAEYEPPSAEERGNEAGSVVVSVHDLASELHRPPERIAKALGCCTVNKKPSAPRSPATGN